MERTNKIIGLAAVATLLGFIQSPALAQAPVAAKTSAALPRKLVGG
jgi:hypothetical protein